MIALSAMPTGQYGLILNAEQWRVHQLSSIGLFLDWSFPEIDSVVLESLQREKTFPIFKRGVLATAGYPKGEVLCAFLKKMKLNISEVVFIDDKIEYIDSIECELDKEKIKNVSFHYTAATDRSCILDQKSLIFNLTIL